ncbi:MAG: YibE/F family protein [Candidatus Levyibacteriota bacterium]
MLKKVLLLLFAFLILFTHQTFAQTKPLPVQEEVKGSIVSVDAKDFDEAGKLQKIIFDVKLDDGNTIKADFQPSDSLKLDLNEGDQVVMTKSHMAGATSYQIIDNYRLPSLLWFLLVFAIIAILIVGRKGIGSLLGLLVSLGIILYGIVPLILKGFDPLLVTIGFSFLIILVTTYLAHGISRQTTIALVSTFISLLIALGLSVFSIELLNINGFGSEDVYNLSFAMGGTINAKGLLLSGIIIATLGALNDVTITQTATIFELKKLNKDMKFLDMIKSGLNIGREHGASMVNTIVLAYAGSSLFVFIFFLVNPQKQPLWAMMNNEFMVEEFVKTLGGTIGILMSVPIVTLLAAWLVDRRFRKKSS